MYEKVEKKEEPKDKYFQLPKEMKEAKSEASN
jgi:hypothetical protein